MASYTPREIYEKAINSSEYDKKMIILFGLNGEEILKRIEFYENHKNNNEYLKGYKEGFEAGLTRFMEKFK